MITNDIETFYKNMEIHDKRKIAKLEKEIEELKEQLANDIDRYEDTISYQLGFSKGKEEIKKEIKKEILEFVNNLKGGDKQEFMGYGGYELLELLGDKENE